MKKSTLIKNVDDYLAAQPPKVRAVLEKLRQTILKAAPEAEEILSYQMPAYKFHGVLVYFAAFTNHCSFFPGSRILNAMKDDVIAYKTSTGTLRFTMEKPLPATLIRKIVNARVRENLERLAKKKK